MRSAIEHPPVIDAEYVVVSGPYRIGEEHRKHRHWHFTGLYDDDGWPLFRWQEPPMDWRPVKWALWLCAFVGLLALIAGAWDAATINERMMERCRGKDWDACVWVSEHISDDLDRPPTARPDARR